MKVLYIGHYKENGGWANASTNRILALDQVGVDVVCRNITLTQDKQNIHPKILELEQKSSEGCDVCIQHILPHHLVGSTAFRKNIGIVETETLDIRHLSWFVHLQKMDEIWVANHDSWRAVNGYNDKKVVVMPHCHDIERYTQRYNPINIPPAEGKFKFYYVGDLNERKNIRSIIRCFHSEFDRSEPVCMIFKIKKFGMSPDQLRQYFDSILQEEKTKLRIHRDVGNYIKDIIINDDVPDDFVMALHQYCDCFICPSHGEAWSIPAFDAMAFGNTPICSHFGGPSEFIDPNNDATGQTIRDGGFAVCQCSDAAFEDIFTGREMWFNPCERIIKWHMRHYYQNRDKLKYKQEGLKQAQKFSFEVIGNKMKEQISEQSNG